MASPSRAVRKPPQEALEKIISCFNRSYHPIYLGPVAVEVGWSLAQTQEMFDVLVERGSIHALTNEEKIEQKLPE